MSRGDGVLCTLRGSPRQKLWGVYLRHALPHSVGYLGSGRACRCAGGHSPVVDWCASPAGRLSAQLWADASQVRNVIRVRSLPNVRALALAAEGNKEAVSAAVVQGFHIHMVSTRSDNCRSKTARCFGGQVFRAYAFHISLGRHPGAAMLANAAAPAARAQQRAGAIG